MNSLRRYDLVLGLYPTTRGFAFVLFEGPLAPVDWGVKELRGAKRNARCLAAIRNLVARYEPDVIVLEDLQGDTRRAPRIRGLTASIERFAEERGTRTRRYPRDRVRVAFSRVGAITKGQIAQVIARHIPALERHLPPRRKPWMSEDPRMGLFDATALVLLFFQDRTNPPDDA